MNEDQSMLIGSTNGAKKILFIELPLTMEKGIKYWEIPDMEGETLIPFVPIYVSKTMELVPY